MTTLTLSPLSHTWLVDLDGTVLKNSGYLHGGDELLPGVRAFWDRIPDGDWIILLTARDQADRDATLAFIDAQGIRYDQAIFGLPSGERVLINDTKPRGLVTALALAVVRDGGLGGYEIEIDPER